jgi:transposase
MITLKQIRVLLKVYTDDGYEYQPKVFKLKRDRQMSKKELKQLQKRLAARYKVGLNMIAATIEENV